MSSHQVLVGAVAYTPNVVPIWEGIREYFADSETPMDFALYSNYGRLVESLLDGSVDVAWNTNLAYVRTVMRTQGECRALAMRDTDANFATVFVAKAGSGLRGPEAALGRRLALGSADSAQAAILPLYYLDRAGVPTSKMDVIRFNSDLGKHGDTGQSEFDAIHAVLRDEADIAAIGVTTWQSIGAGNLLPGSLEEVWQTERYSHCNFTALPTLADDISTAWTRHLLNMSWENPEHRRILELEGLREWVMPVMTGYETLFAAVEEQEISDRW